MRNIESRSLIRLNQYLQVHGWEFFRKKVKVSNWWAITNSQMLQSTGYEFKASNSKKLNQKPDKDGVCSFLNQERFFCIQSYFWARNKRLNSENASLSKFHLLNRAVQYTEDFHRSNVKLHWINPSINLWRFFKMQELAFIYLLEPNIINRLNIWIGVFGWETIKPKNCWKAVRVRLTGEL
jgi:hypothetical protein